MYAVSDVLSDRGLLLADHSSRGVLPTVGASLCNCETSIMRRFWSTGGGGAVATWKENVIWFIIGSIKGRGNC